MRLNFKTKLLLLVVFPLIVSSICLTALSVFQSKKLGDANVKKFSETLISLRKSELKNYVEIAQSSMSLFSQDPNFIDTEDKENALELARSMHYGNDGYFFLLDRQGVMRAHREKPVLEGKDLTDLQDSNGVYFVRSMVSNSLNSGGGFTDYVWEKPSKGRDIGKISYTTSIDNSDWVLGTGLYVDDLDDMVAELKSEIDQNISDTLLLISGIGLLITFIVSVIGGRVTFSEGKFADTKLKQLSEKVVKSQESERARVSRNLQKNINTGLTEALTHLKQFYNDSIPVDEKKSPEFTKAVKILYETISNVSRISNELMPEVLEKQGLFEAIKSLVADLKQSGEYDVEFSLAQISDQRLRYDLEISIYRIVQEAIENIKSHSNAKKIKIRVNQAPGTISLYIQDDGVGFDVKRGLKSGLGLADMRVRAEAYGGQFQIFSSIDRLTLIKAQIPTQIDVMETKAA